ncbi:MAG TPA: polysaccharide biosynthesis C-terminal domain-containing protein [Methylomirabilota bacterium]
MAVAPTSSRPASAVTNVVANAGGFLIALVTAYVMTPFLIHTLGDQYYGLLVFAGEVTAYVAMVDLGLRGAVPIFVAHHQGKGDTRGVARVTSSVFWALLTLAAVVSVVSVAFFVWRRQTPGLRVGDETAFVLGIAVAGVLAALPLDVFSGALGGARRLDLVNAADSGGKLLIALVVYLGLRAGYGLVYVVSAQATGRVLAGIAAVVLARSVVEGLSIARADTSVRELRSLFHFCSRTFILNVARMLSDRSDAIVITSLLGLQAVTYYAVPKMMVDYCLAAVSAVATGMTPHFVRLYAREEWPRLREAFLDATRLTGVGALMFVAYLAAFGEPFMRLWLGARYVNESGAPVVLLILLVGCVPRLFQGPAWQMIFASRNVGPGTRIVVAEGIIKLGLSLLLARMYGIRGVAVATLLSFWLTSGVLIPRHVVREFGIPPARYVVLGIVRPAVAAILAFALSVLVLTALPPTTWPRLVGDAALAGMLGLIGCWFIALTEGDRRLALNTVAAMGPSPFRR